MRPALAFLLLLSIISLTLHAQDQPPTLNIGDPAPPLRVREWLKGTPIHNFEKGQVYVLEFWAVWCAPCRAAIPRLSVLAEKYKGRINFIGIDVMEQGINSFEKVKAFVESMGKRMNYPVAAEDSNFMTSDYLDAFRARGIPRSIVVNAEGRVAWIGHPMELDKILPQIVKNKWNVQKALVNRIQARYLDSLDHEVYYRLIPYRENVQNPDDPGKPELTLLAINSIVINEPRLKYAPTVAYQTFTALLKTDLQKAFEYGKAAMDAPVYTYPAFEAIVNVVKTYGNKISLPPKIYELAADALERLIDSYAYPEIIDMHYEHSLLAEWYARGGKKSKAKEARQKAIKALNNKKENSSKKIVQAN